MEWIIATIIGVGAVAAAIVDLSDASKVIGRTTRSVLAWHRPILRQLKLYSRSTDLPESLATKIIGRADDIDVLRKTLLVDKSSVLLEGMGGIGKSTLAWSIANALDSEDRFKEIVWVSSKEEELNLTRVLDQVRVAHGGIANSTYDPEKKLQKTLELVKKQPTLIVIDNFETTPRSHREEILGFINNLPEPSVGIITSRPLKENVASTYPNIEIMEIRGLGRDDASRLAMRELKRIGIKTTDEKRLPENLASLYSIVKGNPLAIRLAISRLRKSTLTFPALLDRLRLAEDELFEFLFEQNWTTLGETARIVLVLSTLFPGSFSEKAITSTSQFNSRVVCQALEELISLALLERANGLDAHEIRFDVHPLVSAFASSKKDQYGNDILYKSNLTRYYLNTLERSEVGFWEGRQAYTEFEYERPNLLKLLDWLWSEHDFEHFSALVRRIGEFLYVKGYWSECLELGTRGVEASRKCGNYQNEIWIQVHMIGHLKANRYEVDAAIKSFQAAEKLARAKDFQEGLSSALRNLGRAYRKKQQYTEAWKAYEEALRSARATRRASDVALTLNEMGKLKRDSHQEEISLELFDEALKNAENSSNAIVAGIQCNIAGVALTLGQLGKARTACIAGHQYFTNVDNQEGLATTKWRLAQISKIMDPKAARDYAREAYDIFEKLQMVEECEKIHSEFDL